jgi:hypothetical protein
MGPIGEVGQNLIGANPWKAVFWLRLEFEFLMMAKDLAEFLIPGTCD